MILRILPGVGGTTAGGSAGHPESETDMNGYAQRWAVALLGVAISAAGSAAGPDEQWEMTTQMQMQGMSMPGTKALVCQPATPAYDPGRGAMDKNCTVSDVRVVGNKSFWKMRCTGADAMQGEGEMMRTPDLLKGTMKMQVEGMDMTMVMSGRRVGSCSQAAEKKKIDAMIGAAQAKSDAAQREVCATLGQSAVKSGGYQPKMPAEFAGGGMCADARPGLCQQARTFAAGFDGYLVYAGSKGWVAAACGITLAANRAQLCPRAFAAKKYVFLKRHCPVEAKAARASHCQGFGRGYTADAANPYAALCRP